MTSSTAARQRAERELGAPVGPRLSQPCEHYFRGTQCLPTIVWAAELFCTQEMKLATTPVARAAGDHPEVADAAVLAGLGVAQVAGDAVVAGDVRAADEVQRDVADGVRVGLHGLLDEAVGGLGRDRRGDRLGAHEDLLERVLRTGGGRATDEVDRARRGRAGDLAPVADRRRRRSPWIVACDRLASVFLRVGDEADRVTGDLVEEDAVRVAGLRVARRVADRDAARGDVGDAHVGAALGELELHLARVGLHVGLGQQRRERGDGRRAAHRDRGRGLGRARDDGGAGRRPLPRTRRDGGGGSSCSGTPSYGCGDCGRQTEDREKEPCEALVPFL